MRRGTQTREGPQLIAIPRRACVLQYRTFNVCVCMYVMWSPTHPPPVAGTTTVVEESLARRPRNNSGPSPPSGAADDLDELPLMFLVFFCAEAFIRSRTAEAAVQEHTGSTEKQRIRGRSCRPFDVGLLRWRLLGPGRKHQPKWLYAPRTECASTGRGSTRTHAKKKQCTTNHTHAARAGASINQMLVKRPLLCSMSLLQYQWYHCTRVPRCSRVNCKCSQSGCHYRYCNIAIGIACAYVLIIVQAPQRIAENSDWCLLLHADRSRRPPSTIRCFFCSSQHRPP